MFTPIDLNEEEDGDIQGRYTPRSKTHRQALSVIVVNIRLTAESGGENEIAII